VIYLNTFRSCLDKKNNFISLQNEFQKQFQSLGRRKTQEEDDGAVTARPRPSLVVATVSLSGLGGRMLVQQLGAALRKPIRSRRRCQRGLGRPQLPEGSPVRLPVLLRLRRKAGRRLRPV